MPKKLILSSLLVLSVALLGGCGGADMAEPTSGSSGNSSSSGSNGSSGSNNSPDLDPPPKDSTGVTLTADDIVSGEDIDPSATEFYFSYDESASTASRDLSLFAIDNGREPYPEWGRAYEFLNAESFAHLSTPEDKTPFEISMAMYKAEPSDVALAERDYTGDLYALGVNITGPELNKETRPNVVLTLLVDTSGSMDGGYAKETVDGFFSRMDVTKHALLQLTQSLKEGDVLNLVTFEDSVRVALSDWVFDPDNSDYVTAITNLSAFGGTNIYRGLVEAYSLANESFDAKKSNRVIVLTDAFINRNFTYPATVHESIEINGTQGIHLSGIGIGSGFHDPFLNKITEIGKGTYSAMITPSDAERIMTEGFMRFIDSAVSNVQFKLSYPQGLDQLKSAAEDISTDSSEVSKINFAYNSSQFFLEMFNGSADESDEITLTATFEKDGSAQSVTTTQTVAQLMAANGDEIKSAILVTQLAELISKDLDCDEVMNAGIYKQDVDTTVFKRYKTAIADYCAMWAVET